MRGAGARDDGGHPRVCIVPGGLTASTPKVHRERTADGRRAARAPSDGVHRHPRHEQHRSYHDHGQQRTSSPAADQLAAGRTPREDRTCDSRNESGGPEASGAHPCASCACASSLPSSGGSTPPSGACRIRIALVIAHLARRGARSSCTSAQGDLTTIGSLPAAIGKASDARRGARAAGPAGARGARGAPARRAPNAPAAAGSPRGR